MTITKDNFSNGTHAKFNYTGVLPARVHDLTVTNPVTGEVIEAFKFEPNGVYRTSKNWGGLGANSWLINSKLDNQLKTGYCSWNGFTKIKWVKG